MKNTAGSNPFAYGKPITLDTLDDLFSHHRDMLGGWHMGPDGGDGGGDGGGEGGSGGQGGGSGSGSGGDGGGQGGSGGSGSGSGGQGGSGGSGGGQNDDLGFPKDTPWREMTDKQATAYWQHQAKRHEGRVKDLVGDRTPEEIRKDLEEYQRIQREQQTPAEQALTDAQEKGKKEGLTAARRESATTLFRGTLEAQGVTGEDLDELVAGLNVDTFISNDGVDTTKLTNFAKRFTSDKENSGAGSGRRRDFGGGQRRTTEGQRGSGGKSEAQRRFGKKSTSTE